MPAPSSAPSVGSVKKELPLPKKGVPGVVRPLSLAKPAAEISRVQALAEAKWRREQRELEAKENEQAAETVEMEQPEEEEEGQLEAAEEDLGAQADESLELHQAKQLEEMLWPATEKVVSAEEQVDKVEMAAAPLHVDMADDLKEVMHQAIKETELLVRGAQSEISEARRFISAKNAQVQRFVPAQRTAAMEEFGGLQKRLNAAQERLSPFKNVRHDYEQRMRNRKFLEELSSRLAGAEIEVEKASMMTAPLGGDNVPEGIKETELALSGAQAALSQAFRLIASKQKTAEGETGELAEELKLLRVRAKEAQEKLDEVRKTLKDAQARAQADALLQEVSQKVSEVEDELQAMGDSELPFLAGSDTDLDMDTLLEEASKIAQKVQTALTEAQMLIARKLVEVARYADGPAKFVKEEMQAMHKRIDKGREQLQQFRQSTADRQRGHLLAEVEAKVAVAEGDVSQMREAIQAVKAMGKPGEAITDPFAEVVETANAAERTAQASILLARKYLLQKTSELKKLNIAGAGSGSELGKLQTKVSSLQQEVVRLKSATKDAEEKMRVKQMLVEVVSALQAAESEVNKVAAVAVQTVGTELPSVESVEKLDTASSAAEAKLSATAKVVNVKLKSAEGLLKEELVGMRKRITVAESKLQEVLKQAKDQKDRAEAVNLVSESALRVSQAEAALQEAVDAESPFLKGIEGMSAAIWQSAISTCEVKAAAAQKAITDGRKLISEKLAIAKKLASNAADTCSKDLEPLRKRLDAAAAKLAELKRDMAERRRRTQMQESGEKVKAVEAAVQKMATAMGRLSPDKDVLAALAPQEAMAILEEVAEAQQEAQEGCADARKYVLQRLQEAKSVSEAQRSTMIADLNKLQSRLMHCQVELSKLSKQVTEREQSYVQQVNLQKALATATKVKGPTGEVRATSAAETVSGGQHFLKCKALRDEQSGWILNKDSPDAEPLAIQRENVYVCRSIIAMTDAADLKNCKIIRKVRPGEALQRLSEEADGETEDEIHRVEFKAYQDDRQGFVSLRGNKGTVYVERQAGPLFVLTKQVELRAAASLDSSVLRLLDAGEALEPGS